MGRLYLYESIVAGVLIRLLGGFVEEQDLGFVMGADATLRLVPGLDTLPVRPGCL
jgi:hypothetical protein